MNDNFKLPYDIPIYVGECEELNAWYYYEDDPPYSEIVICYELIEEIVYYKSLQYDDDFTIEDSTISVVDFVLYHELGHAFIHLYNLPITGAEEDVADQFATYVLLAAYDEEHDAALYVIDAAEYWLDLSNDYEILEEHYAGLHSLDIQRFYDLACYVYGSDSSYNSDLIDYGYVTENRADYCYDEYYQILNSWDRLLEGFKMDSSAPSPPIEDDRTFTPPTKLDRENETIPKTSPALENAGKFGAEHIHASLLVKIFGDKFDFSTPNYQVKTKWIHFENQDGDTIHRHSTGVELEFLFNSMSVGVDENCFVFPDGRQFCTNEDYSLKFYINGERVTDIREYIVEEDDRILISFGNEDRLAIEKELAELNAQAINRVTPTPTVPNEEKICSEGTVFKDGKCEIIRPPSTTPQIPPVSSDGGGCLIATAAFGSEMAPQVQFLREIRDNTVMNTQSGATFMTGFNQFYYSFSPAVADYERENPVFKEMVKVSLTPLLTSLALLNYVEIDSEEEMLGYGIGIILLNIGMYFVAPAVLIISLKKQLDSFRGQ